MKKTYLFLFLFIPSVFFGQNLVLNPSFENVNIANLQCSWYVSEAQFTAAISNWDYPNDGSTDVYHTSLPTTCFSSPFSTDPSSVGTQAPRTGNAMSNIVVFGSGGCTPYREYLQGELSTPLVVGTTYNVSAYVSLADNSNRATNNIGFKFTTARQNTGSMCVWVTTPDVNYTATPITNKTGWTLLSFTFTPTVAGLRFFSFGNFFNDVSTTTTSVTGTMSTIRYFVDDISVSVVCPVQTATWTNPSPICANAGSISLTPLVTGTAGGTWSGTGVSGTTFNPASGTQSVTYTVGTAPCTQTSTQTITVLPDVNPAWTNPSSICVAAGSINLNTLITGTTGGTWSGTGVSGTTFNPASGSQSVTYTVGTSPCQETSTQTITVVPDVNPAWTNPGPLCAAAGGTVTLVPTQAGGAWSGTGVTAGGVFSLSAGTQSITYTVGTSPCQESSTQTITVRPDVNPAWTNPSSICANASGINLNTLITGTTGGTWSGTGVSGTTFNPASGTQSVTYTVGTAPCQETSTQTITVIPDVNPAWTNPGPLCAAAGGTVTLVPTQAGGTWSGTGVTAGGVFSLSAGTQSITYTVGTSPCQESSTQTITVRPDVNPAWTNPSSICANASGINLNTLITGTIGGTWSGTGVSGTMFNPASGTQSVTYTVGTAPCQETSTQTITVIPDVNPAWTNPSPVCANAGSINLNTLITGTTGGTWSGAGVSGTSFNPASGSQSVTYTVGTAPCQETSTLTITVIPDVDPAWTNPSPICAASGSINLNTLITGTTGGTWSGTGVSGTSFNPASGTQSVTYTVGTAPCVETSTQTITVSAVSAAWTNPGPICEGANPVNLSTLVTGSGGGTFTGTGVTSNQFDPTGLGGTSVNITYTVGASPCTEVSTLTVVINNDDDASFSYTQSSFCITGTNPLPTISGTSGGTFTIVPSGTINPTTGEIDLGASGVGSFTVIYNTNSAGNPCPVSDTTTITITTGQTAGFSYDNAQYCQNAPAPILTLNGGATAGNFTASPTGLFISANGSIILTTSAAGVYTVFNNVPAANGCAPTLDSTTIEVLQIDDASFSYLSGNAYCTNDNNPIATPTGTLGGIFSILPSGTINAATGEIDITATGIGSFTVIYNTTSAGNPCSVIDSVQITITNQNTININPITPICLGDSLILSATTTGNGVVTWYSDAAGTNIIGTGSPFLITLLTADSFTFYAAYVGACSSEMDSVNVIVQQVVAQASGSPLSGSSPLNVQFSNGSIGATNYFWDFANGNSDTILNPSQIFDLPGIYQVILIATDGLCWDTAFVTVDVFDESSILIPNVFTPNGDGNNDFFFVDGVNLKSVEGEIFNRWGQKMFAWDNVNGKWDGRTLSGNEAPDGTYFYIIKALGNDQKEYFQKGTLSLFR